MVVPKAEGKTFLVVRHDKDETRIPVEVSGLKTPAPVSFATQVMPILNRAGCNGGGQIKPATQTRARGSHHPTAGQERKSDQRGERFGR